MNVLHLFSPSSDLRVSVKLNPNEKEHFTRLSWKKILNTVTCRKDSPYYAIGVVFPKAVAPMNFSPTLHVYDGGALRNWLKTNPKDPATGQEIEKVRYLVKKLRIWDRLGNSRPLTLAEEGFHPIETCFPSSGRGSPSFRSPYRGDKRQLNRRRTACYRPPSFEEAL